VIGGSKVPLIQSETRTEQSSLIKWNPSYGVGIVEIDQQHRILMQMINEIQYSVVSGQTRDAQNKIMDSLSNYTRDHFTNEERLFDIYAYPWAITHKAEHQAFSQKVAAVAREHKMGKSEVSGQILTFLSEWLINHIIGKDKTYSYFFALKGLK
jgi:hemerythrin